MTDTGAWLGADKVEHSPPVRAWLDELPATGGPELVFARFAAGARVEEAREERERSARLAAVRERREDMTIFNQLHGIEAPTHADILMRALALSELEDALEKTAAEKAADERAAAAERRTLALQAELAPEQRSHRSASRALSDATGLIMRGYRSPGQRDQPAYYRADAIYYR